MSAHPNNTSTQKARWESDKSNSGSRFIHVTESVLSSRKHRKGYRAPRGRFETRVLQQIAARWLEAAMRQVKGALA